MRGHSHDPDTRLPCSTPSPFRPASSWGSRWLAHARAGRPQVDRPRRGTLNALLEAVKVLPRTEDDWQRISPPSGTTSIVCTPGFSHSTDLDETAEALERSMSSLQA